MFALNAVVIAARALGGDDLGHGAGEVFLGVHTDIALDDRGARVFSEVDVDPRKRRHGAVGGADRNTRWTGTSSATPSGTARDAPSAKMRAFSAAKASGGASAIRWIEPRSMGGASESIAASGATLVPPGNAPRL